MRRSIQVVLAVGLVIGGWHASAGAVSAAVCDGSGAALDNGGFETPGVEPETYTPFPAAEVPPWQTTDIGGQIEIWGDGFEGVPAGEGGSFAELNANSAGTLYQDVVTIPGQTMHWSLLHRARVGTDVMQVLIGNAVTADPMGATGWDFVSADLSDDTTAWGTHAGDYVVPAGQTCTRFAFRAVSSGAGDDSFGNFLDAVGFSIPVDPTPTIRITQPPTDAGPFVPGNPSGSWWPALSIVIGTIVLAAAGATSRRTSRSRRARR